MPERKDDPTVPAVCVVGAGPRGTSILERIAANAPELLGDRPLDIHLVDPYEPGAGRTWRTGQSSLLWMNSAADQVTMFPDDSVRCAGPIVPGPTTAQWHGLSAHGPLNDGSYAARPAQGAYLRWFFDGVRDRLPPGIRLRVHRGTAVDIRRDTDGRRLVVLDNGTPPIAAGQVLLAQGHTDVRTRQRPGLLRLGPARADAAELAQLPAGGRVIVRGLGLVFIDCLLLLTEGRGGRFERTGPHGRLRYLPSGREPLLYCGSRRGVPPYPKPGYALDSPEPPLRFATAETCRARIDRRDPDFDRDLWPLVLQELCWAYYQELFTAHGSRTRMSWDSFAVEYARFGREDERTAKLLRTAVPDPADRIDLDGLDTPLSGGAFATPGALQRRVRAHLTDSLHQRRDPAHSAHLAVVRALSAVAGVVGELLNSGELPPDVTAAGYQRFTFGAFLSSGPPPLRAEQLIALSEAGIVTFTGPDTTVRADPAAGVYRAESPVVGGAVEAPVLLDARLPEPDLSRTADPLLRSLLARGEISEETADDGTGVPRPTGRPRTSGPEGHPVDAHGTVHRDLRIAGPQQFPRPGVDAAFFRHNDSTARALLTAARTLP